MTVFFVEVLSSVIQATPSCPGCVEMSSPTMMSGMLIGLVLLVFLDDSLDTLPGLRAAPPIAVLTSILGGWCASLRPRTSH